MPGLAIVPQKKYPKVPEKAPGRLYTVGEVGKLKYVNRADRDGWYTRFDAATGAFCQLDGKFSEYTIKYPYQAASSSTVSRGIENKEFRATGRSIKGIENGTSLCIEESIGQTDGLDLSSLQYSSSREETYREKFSLGRLRTKLVELAEKKSRLSSQLQVVDASLEGERLKYLPNYALSPYGLMSAKRFPAKRKVIQSKRKKTFYRTPGGQVIYYPGRIVNSVCLNRTLCYMYVH